MTFGFIQIYFIQQLQYNRFQLTMQFQLISPRASLQFHDIQRNPLFSYSPNHQNINQLNLIHSLDSLLFNKNSNVTSTVASQQSTPFKNSEISTDQQESLLFPDFSEKCESFYGIGACMKGCDCKEGHFINQRIWKNMKVSLHLFDNFPQMILIRGNRRIKSFLE